MSAGGVLRSLQERGLIEVVGRSEGLGRPLLYGTTPLFLELLGAARPDRSAQGRRAHDRAAAAPRRDPRAEDDAAAYVRGGVVSEMRLQRALARAGVASRRAAEELIEAGQVRVDGKVAELGMKVDPDRQTHHGGRASRRSCRSAAGWRSTSRSAWSPPPSDEEGRRTVFDFIPDRRASPTSAGST